MSIPVAPVAGYQPLTEEKVALVNQNKVLEELVLRQIDRHVRDRSSVEIDQAQVQIARRDIENAFMRLNRAVFQPKRLINSERIGFAQDAAQLAASLASD